jgi:hypothetical protein
MQVLLIAIVIIILYLVYGYVTAESFATKQEKANTLLEWFKSTDVPTYTAYKKEITGSDIVEYERVRSAVANGATANRVAQLI